MDDGAGVLHAILFTYCCTLVSEGYDPHAVAEAANNLVIEIEQVERDDEVTLH